MKTRESLDQSSKLGFECRPIEPSLRHADNGASTNRIAGDRAKIESFFLNCSDYFALMFRAVTFNCWALDQKTPFYIRDSSSKSCKCENLNTYARVHTQPDANTHVHTHTHTHSHTHTLTHSHTHTPETYYLSNTEIERFSQCGSSKFDSRHPLS